jgi:drug/metabolite transporter (DMT)-like permease
LEKENLKKGIIFGVFGTILVGLQPIVINLSPEKIDAYIFAAMTVIIEALIFFPLMMIERSKIRSNYMKELITIEEMDSFLNGYKKNKLLLIFVGSAFGFGMILFFIGYQLAGAINGSLAQKATVFFSLLFGWLILHEKITKKQILFSGILFLGLILAVTQGSFNILEINVGVLILLLLSGIWMFTHSLTKPILDKNEATPIQMVFIRNAVGGVILISTYFVFFPIENIKLLLDLVNIFWFCAMGTVYSIGLFCWYKTLAYLDVNKASLLYSPTLIITAIFSTILLREIFTILHLIGTIIIILSIIMIVREKKG